jgi:secondary thiamine-phosphate synthase enzyme
MKIDNITIEKKTKKLFDIIDVTDEIITFIENSEINNGLINIQTMHTTAMLILNENEPLLLEDIKNSLENIASSKIDYKHDNFDLRTVNMCNNECKNGHSHCKAIHLSPNITLNLINKILQIGEWQRILFIELDSARDRRLQVQIIGN